MLAAMPKPLAERHGGALKLHRRGSFGEVSIAPHQPQLPANPLIVGTGTGLAINNSTTGGAALSPPRSGRGGARNSADRESYALTKAQIANLKAAERHSRKIGLSFTRMISIHWQAAGVPLEQMAAATGRFIGLMTKALKRHGSDTAWLWVHENCGPKGGHREKGGHCHLLAHVPAELVPIVVRLQRGWLKCITLRSYRARVIYSKPIGGRLGLERGNPELHAINLEAALAYVLKGATPEAASQFGLALLEPGGRIVGRRCSTSQNIGAKARRGQGA